MLKATASVNCSHWLQEFLEFFDKSGQGSRTQWMCSPFHSSVIFMVQLALPKSKVFSRHQCSLKMFGLVCLCLDQDVLGYYRKEAVELDEHWKLWLLFDKVCNYHF